MIYGDKSRFAVQWELDKDPGGVWLFGRICYWIGGHMVGDYELGATLSDVLVQLRSSIGDCGNRSSARFCIMRANDIYADLQSALFDGDALLKQIAEDETWARFNISLAVDVFDLWRLYLIDCSDRSHILVGQWDQQHKTYPFTYFINLHRGEFDTVINNFVHELTSVLSHNGGNN